MGERLERSPGWADDDRTRNKALNRQASAYERLAAAAERIATVFESLMEPQPSPPDSWATTPARETEVRP